MDIFIDKAWFSLLNGLSIDYQAIMATQATTGGAAKQAIGCKLTYDNPNEAGRCGCGESFIARDTT